MNWMGDHLSSTPGNGCFWLGICFCCQILKFWCITCISDGFAACTCSLKNISALFDSLLDFGIRKLQLPNFVDLYFVIFEKIW